MATATAKMGLLLPLKLQGFCGELLPKRRGLRRLLSSACVLDLSSNVSKMLAVRGSGENLLLLLSLKWELLIPHNLQGFSGSCCESDGGFEGRSAVDL